MLVVLMLSVYTWGYHLTYVYALQWRLRIIGIGALQYHISFQYEWFIVGCSTCLTRSLCLTRDIVTCCRLVTETSSTSSTMILMCSLVLVLWPSSWPDWEDSCEMWFISTWSCMLSMPAIYYHCIHGRWLVLSGENDRDCSTSLVLVILFCLFVFLVPHWLWWKKNLYGPIKSWDL